MSKSLFSFGSVILLWLLSSAGSSAALVESDDPRYGPKTLTIDTSTGLAWLDLSLSSGFSYMQAENATQLHGLFEGFRHATAEEVFGLYQSAGIPGPDWYPESSPAFPPILSLISLVGATSSQDGHPEALGISGTQAGPGMHWGLGLDFLYLDGVPGYVAEGQPGWQSGFGLGDTPSFPSWGNWLVRPIPEPSVCSLGGLAGFLFVRRRATRPSR